MCIYFEKAHFTFKCIFSKCLARHLNPLSDTMARLTGRYLNKDNFTVKLILIDNHKHILIKSKVISINWNIYDQLWTRYDVVSIVCSHKTLSSSYETFSPEVFSYWCGNLDLEAGGVHYVCIDSFYLNRRDRSDRMFPHIRCLDTHILLNGL